MDMYKINKKGIIKWHTEEEKIVSNTIDGLDVLSNYVPIIKNGIYRKQLFKI